MRRIGNPNQLPSGAAVPNERITRARSCVVIPNRTTDPEGFIETGQAVPGTNVPCLVSVGAVREMGRLIGLVSGEEVAELKAKLGVLKARLEDIEDQERKLDEAEQIIQEVSQ